MMVGMSSIRFAGFPKDRAEPANGGDDQVDDGTEHEDLERAVPITKPGEYHAEDAVAQRENEPGDEAGRQKIAGPPHKSNNRNSGEKAEGRGGGDVSFESKMLEHRNAIGKNEPTRKDQDQKNTRVNTGANGRVAENVKPTESWQMGFHRHLMLGSQDANDHLTRISGNGCATAARIATLP